MRLEDDPSLLRSGDWQRETLAHAKELEESVQALYGLDAVASDALREVDVLNQAHAKALLEGAADLTLWIEEELEPEVALEVYEAEGKHPLVVFAAFFSPAYPIRSMHSTLPYGNTWPSLAVGITLTAASFWSTARWPGLRSSGGTPMPALR